MSSKGGNSMEILSLGEKIKKLRKENMTLKELAEIG